MNRSLQLFGFYALIILFIASCEYGLDEAPPTSEAADDSAFALSDGRAVGSSASAGGGGGSSNNGGNGQSQPGVLTAGEWNDLDNWNFWNGLLAKDTFGFQDKWQFYPQDRYSFIVKDRNLLPITDASISLYDDTRLLWQTRTDNSGSAELWPSIYSEASDLGNKIEIAFQGEQFTFTNIQLAAQNNINLPISLTDKFYKLDVAFVVDATGSMADELEYLKTEFLDVINQVQATDGLLELRTGSVFYRDEGDDYVTRVSNLKDNHQQTLDFIKAQSADGGGDYPEAVHMALNNAIEQLSWSTNARARLLFLVLDAPPHSQPESVMQQIRVKTKLAAEKGIKIIPITASGIDKATEFLMRFMAITTNGTYVFITDDSGIGNDHLEPTVGEYEVEFLNDLMVRLINKYAQ